MLKLGSEYIKKLIFKVSYVESEFQNVNFMGFF